MHTHLFRSLATAALVLLPFVGSALDSPHDKAGASTSACYFCHNLFVSSPTGKADYSPACLSCHNQTGRAPFVKWDQVSEAAPGSAGTSHSWSRAASNPAFGANAQLSAKMQALLVDGKLQCVICHDPHTTAVPADPNSMHVSVATETPLQAIGNALQVPKGDGRMSVRVASGAVARAYRIKIQTVTPTGGTFVISHDYGWKADSWLVRGAGWVPGPADGPGLAFDNGTEYGLDVAGTFITFTAGFVAGDYWDVVVSYPFLRYHNVSDAWCYQCHKERQMNHVRARGLDTAYLPNGVRKFSHPVGVPLNANQLGLDQPVALDVDGTAGSSLVDGLDGATPVQNKTNDLVFKGGVVGCTTCHAVHNADSNALTVDVH